MLKLKQTVGMVGGTMMVVAVVAVAMIVMVVVIVMVVMAMVLLIGPLLVVRTLVEGVDGVNLLTQSGESELQQKV